MNNFDMRTEHWMHYLTDQNGKLVSSTYAPSSEGPYGPAGVNPDNGTYVYSVRLIAESAIAQAPAEPLMFAIVGQDNKPYLGEQCVAESAEALAAEVKALNEGLRDDGRIELFRCTWEPPAMRT